MGQTQPEFPGGLISNHSLQGTPELAYGITDWWEAGFYAPFAVTDSGQFLSDGGKIRSLFVVPDAAKRDFFYGVNFELSYEMPSFAPTRYALEIRPIIGVRNEEWEFIVNPIVDSSFGAAGEADFAPELRLARNLGQDRFIGIEYYADLGQIGNFLPLNSRAIRYSPSRISSSANSMSSSASATALRQDRTGSSPKLSSATHSRLWGKSNDSTGPDQDKGRSPSRGPHGNTGIPGDRILQIERTRAPAMHSQSIQQYQHPHVFLGETHERNERKTWTVIAICTAMMLAEIVGGVWFGSVALLADGLHMSTHAGALLIAAMAYTYSRRYARDERLSFGTGSLVT